MIVLVRELAGPGGVASGLVDYIGNTVVVIIWQRWSDSIIEMVFGMPFGRDGGAKAAGCYLQHHMTFILY